jgi:hypothetical protein
MRYFIGVICAVMITLAGCGDPDTPDRRGYTKAPLEKPAPMINGEVPGPMRGYAAPIRPRPVVVNLDSAAGGS